MTSPSIIGRTKEIQILQEAYQANEAQLLAVYGRRRIGKTYLISEFFKNSGIYFEMTGIKDGKLSEQLFHFSYEFSKQFLDGNTISIPKNWTQAFTILQAAIEKLGSNEKIILFFDEVPWLASKKSGFLNAFEHSWNRYLSRYKNVIVILCGSAASWIIKNIINNKGGLHGRITRKICLLPFTLSETELFLQSKQIELDRKQIIDVYLALGGIPKYLSYIKRGQSAAQNINQICFSNNGALYDEFENLYRSLFENYQHHLAIVKVLAKSQSGLTKIELLNKAKLSSGGTSSAIIQELLQSGFIAYIPPFGNKKTNGLYRLIDEYSIFYLNWIADIKSIGINNADSDYWLKKYNTPRWYAWSGCAFESLCLKHIAKIKESLGISGISTVESSWQEKADKIEEKGAQIDLIIDRADRCINLCEIKYSESEFIIEKNYSEKLRNKKSWFKSQTHTKKTLFITMITTYGVKINTQYLSVIDNQLTMDDLF